MICLSLVLLRHVKGVMTKNCALSSTCSSLVDCCSGDLCNGAITTGSSVLLMLVTSAIFTVFLWGSRENVTVVYSQIGKNTTKNDQETILLNLLKAQWFHHKVAELLLQILHYIAIRGHKVKTRYATNDNVMTDRMLSFVLFLPVPTSLSNGCWLRGLTTDS